jgi:acetyl esterase/lipase
MGEPIVKPHPALLAVSLFIGLATGEHAAAQMPPDFADKLKSVGRVIDAAGAAALYAPLQKTQPDARVQVMRDLGYGSADANRLDLFVRDDAPGPPKPVLVFVHGGAFVRGDKHALGSPFYDNVMLWAVDHGMIGVNLNFRMPPGSPWPAASEDLGLAVRWVQQHVASVGGDAKRVFLVGHSSGGALVASYVAHPRFHGPGGVGLAGAVFLSANIFDTTTAEPGAPLKAYYGDDATRYAERSSLPGLLETPLRLMVGSAELDPLDFERQALQLQQALCKLNRCPTFVRFAGHSHMSEIYSIHTSDDTVGDAMLAFIRDRP